MSIPYQDLYIYEISGEISGSRTFFKEDFIGCWNEQEASYLFFSRPHDEAVEAFVRDRNLSLLSKEILGYHHFQSAEEFKPFRVGNLFIVPSWGESPVTEGEQSVRLDPGVVFGTGYHSTTRSCLQALWEIYQCEKPKRVLDLGTGTGILALAAAKYGAERVVAVDCNELAYETALRNVETNGESWRIEVRTGRAEDLIEMEVDLICANLHLQVIESLIKKEAFFEKRWLILSGLFVKDAVEVERRLNERSIKIFRKVQDKKWVTLVGLNEGSNGSYKHIDFKF